MHKRREGTGVRSLEPIFIPPLPGRLAWFLQDPCHQDLTTIGRGPRLVVVYDALCYFQIVPSVNILASLIPKVGLNLLEYSN